MGGPVIGSPRDKSTAELVTAMLTLSRLRSEPVPVADLTTRVRLAWQLRQRARYEALAQLLPSLISQAEAAASASVEDQDQAVRVVVHAYNAASSLLRRVGDGQLALVAADRAVRAAQALRDPVLTAAAMHRLANVLLSAGRVNEARTVALEAASLTDPGRQRTPRGVAMWGGLLLTAAVAAAGDGAESEAWELMGEARTGSRLLGKDFADLYSIFGPTNVAIHGVQVAVQLGRGKDAVRRSQEVNPDRLPGSLVERRGQFLIDVAHGHMLQGHDREAVSALSRAEQVAPQEVRLSTEVRDLTLTMVGRQRAGATAGLRELADRIGLE